MLRPMRHTCNWTDLHGAVHASFEGRSGGHRWLVALPEAAEDHLDTVLAALSALDGKGRVDLVVFGEPQAVQDAAHELLARGVLLLGEARPELAGLSPRRCEPPAVQATLEGWMDEVPHGR